MIFKPYAYSKIVFTNIGVTNVFQVCKKYCRIRKYSRMKDW